MKTLVTGANGFIGSHLCEALAAAGHTVRAMVRETSDLTWLEGLDLEFVYADLRSPETLGPAVAGQDWVFHAAAAVRPKDPRDYERVNAQGTKTLSEECVKSGVKRFVLFSSVAAGGPTCDPAAPRTESESPEPVSQYGRGKLEAERALQAMAGRLHSTVLRFPAVYGPRDRDSLILLRNMKAGVIADLGGTFSVVYVKDAVHAAMLAAEKSRVSGSVYYISDGVAHAYEESGRLASELLGRKAVRLKVPGWALKAAGQVSDWFRREGSFFGRDKAAELTRDCWVCSPQKAMDELGFTPRYPMERGMKEAIHWYQEKGWL
jgi:dihydroflavonol-4-reductase